MFTYNYPDSNPTDVQSDILLTKRGQRFASKSDQSIWLMKYGLASYDVKD